MMAQGLGGTGGEVSSAESVAGDVCMYGISEGKLIIVNDWDASKYPIDKYPPIGVVVVPGSHGHYADGKCAIMSLNYMNCDTPQTGGNFQGMYWGARGTDITTLPNLTDIPYIGSNGTIGNVVIGVTNEANLPSNYSTFTAVANPYDDGTNYYSSRLEYIPSPYMNDGSFNQNYSLIDSPSSNLNCLADFDGYNNTKKILEVRGPKDYSQWKPSKYTEVDYPAASCCDMYFTQGTNQGDWYLPSAGELGYIIPRMQDIYDSLIKLIESGLKSAIDILMSSYYSSSEYSSIIVRSINLSDGTVQRNMTTKDYGKYVRAFCLV